MNNESRGKGHRTGCGRIGKINKTMPDEHLKTKGIEKDDSCEEDVQACNNVAIPQGRGKNENRRRRRRR